MIDHIEYNSFGLILSQTNAIEGDRFLYAGQQFDSSTGLYYDHARYYDPVLGRFISQDPAGFSDGDPTNPYRYVGNAPTIFVDPTGRQEVAEEEATFKAITLKIEQAARCLGFKTLTTYADVALAVGVQGIYLFAFGGGSYAGRSYDVASRNAMHKYAGKLPFSKLITLFAISVGSARRGSAKYYNYRCFEQIAIDLIGGPGNSYNKINGLNQTRRETFKAYIKCLKKVS